MKIRMKRNHFFLGIAALAGLSLMGCDDYLDKLPLDSPSSVNFYTNAEEVEMGLMGCYKSLHWEINSEARPWPIILDNATDISWNRSSSHIQQLGNGTATSSSDGAASAWTALYKAISRSNYLLDNVHNAEGSLNAAYYRQVQAEVSSGLQLPAADSTVRRCALGRPFNFD